MRRRLGASAPSLQPELWSQERPASRSTLLRMRYIQPQGRTADNWDCPL